MVERDDLSDLGQLLEALEPFLDRVLIIGGWAHRIYRFDNITIPPYEPIYTVDTDVALTPETAESNDLLNAFANTASSKSSSAMTGLL